jgi:hypothetical protein
MIAYRYEHKEKQRMTLPAHELDLKPFEVGLGHG